jgi:hypothetical protein
VLPVASGCAALVACHALWPGAARRTDPPAPVLRPAVQRIEASDRAVAAALAALERSARADRQRWLLRSFAEYERSVYKEPWPMGKYIVSGDIAIQERTQLQQFFATRIRMEPVQTHPGQLALMWSGTPGALWSGAQRRRLSYCVSPSFGARHGKVVADMETAARAWEQVAAIDFVYQASQDASCTAANPNVVFDVRPVNVHGEYLARAFFPGDPRPARNLMIDESAFEVSPSATLQLAGLLRHQLGHALGLRHEHLRPESGACFDDGDWRPLTSYDRFSVMHYPQCHGGSDWSLGLTALDQNGVACLYGPAPGFRLDPAVCSGALEAPVSVDVPASPAAPASPGEDSRP